MVPANPPPCTLHAPFPSRKRRLISSARGISWLEEPATYRFCSSFQLLSPLSIMPLKKPSRSSFLRHLTSPGTRLSSSRKCRARSIARSGTLFLSMGRETSILSATSLNVSPPSSFATCFISAGMAAYSPVRLPCSPPQLTTQAQ